MTMLRSRLHPDVAGAAATRRVLAPVAAWVLLPMTVGLVQVLTNGSTAPFWWTAALTATAMAYMARWRLEGCIVEVTLAGASARVRSLLDVRRGQTAPWEAVTRLRRDGQDLFVDAGTRIVEFDLSDWPDPEAPEKGHVRRA
jgi:hypothetical protein